MGDDVLAVRWLYVHQNWTCSLIFFIWFCLELAGEWGKEEASKQNDWSAMTELQAGSWLYDVLIEKCCGIIDVIVRRSINYNTCLFLRRHRYFLKQFFVFPVSPSSARADGPAAAVAAICVPAAKCPVTVSCHGMSQGWYSLKIWPVLVNLLCRCSKRSAWLVVLGRGHGN